MQFLLFIKGFSLNPSGMCIQSQLELKILNEELELNSHVQFLKPTLLVKEKNHIGIKEISRTAQN
jgi:hypothetical protein